MVTKIVEEEDGIVFVKPKPKPKSSVLTEAAIHKILQNDPDSFFNSRPAANKHAFDDLVAFYGYWNKHMRGNNLEAVTDLLELNKPKYGIADIEAMISTFAKMNKGEPHSQLIGRFITGLFVHKMDKDDIAYLDIRPFKGTVGWLGSGLKQGKIVAVGDCTDLASKLDGGSVTLYGDVSNCVSVEQIAGKVIVYGSARNTVAHTMYGGTVDIYGNAYRVGDCLKGGTVRIHGNTGAHVGFYMEGGRLIIEGTAALSVGDYMTGGEIYLNGPYSYVASDCKGIIYHKGNKISPLKN